jgi:serine/threonine protein kinase
VLLDNRWETRDNIGEGGQARTFTVVDLKGGGEKLYVAKLLKNKDRLPRFKREIEAVRSLSHEHVVQLIDFNLDGAKPYLIMDYCAGGSLSKAQPFWRESPIMAMQLFQQICEGVNHAHMNGVIHRDLKPDNIFLRGPNGPAVVGDFGICHVESGEVLTLTDEAVGARNYMAPEIEDGRVSDHDKRHDTYSLGKVLYWLLSGRIFSREKHRDPKWDLMEKDDHYGWKNPFMEHVNRLLDYMIVQDIEQRRYVDSILLLLQETIRLVEKEYNPVNPQIPQRCYYCGRGRYIHQGGGRDGSTSVHNFGLNPVGSNDWRFWVCNKCGHVQFFRLDWLDPSDRWD